jgi:hypothetical protein
VSSIHLVSPALLTSCRVAVVFAIQSWLAESPEQAKSSATPAYFQVGMSGEFSSLGRGDAINSSAAMSLLVSYSSLFLPPPPGMPGMGSGTEAPPAAPPS